jgi:anti-sigma regulatory factor (Ser/Thr protein kinase)
MPNNFPPSYNGIEVTVEEHMTAEKLRKRVEVEKERRDRLRMFSMIARDQGKTIKQIEREFDCTVVSNEHGIHDVEFHNGAIESYFRVKYL